VKSPIDPDIDIQGLVAKYAGTGTSKGQVAKGRPGYKEVITSNSTIGRYISEEGVDLGPTKRFTIHYAKDGTHIIPARPEGD